MYYVALWLAGIWYRLTYHIRVEGKENIPKHGGVVYASNHMSYADPGLVALLCPFQRCNFIAKEELFRNKLFGVLIRGLGAFPVTRGSGDTGVIDEAIRRLEKKRNIVIFPEGTRSKDGRVGRGKTGVALIAAKTGVDVVPVGLTYTPKLHFRSRIIVRVGKPIAAKELALSDDPRPRELSVLRGRIMDEIRSLVDEPPLPVSPEPTKEEA